MPRRETAPIGAPCWVDLTTADPARSRSFYTQLFGWTAEDPNPDFGGYFNFLKDGVRIAGCMGSMPGSGTPDVWSVYLATDDAARTVAATTAHGGAVAFAPQAVGDLGSMALITDATGAHTGLWQPASFQGIGQLGEPGTPSWFELSARDYPAAVDFYRAVLGWNAQVVSDTPELRYTVLTHGDDMLAGIVDASSWLPDGAPAHWSVYFAVTDADATLQKVEQLGGRVLQPAEDTPYGRLATAADATGAQFKLMAPNAAMPMGGA